MMRLSYCIVFFFSSRRRHTRCALVTGVQTCALPILSIGAYPEISLKQARQTAYEARHKIASGGDPAMEKRKQKIRAEFLSAQTFEAVAREYIDQMMVKSGRADATIVKANFFLEQLVDAIGHRPTDAIAPVDCPVTGR